MKNYQIRKAKYRGIPCWYNLVTDEIKGRNWFYDLLVDIMLWVDVNIFEVEEFPIWLETDEL